MAGLLDNKVALITGAGAGIGRAAVLQFLREGANVVFGDIDTRGAEETLELCKMEGYSPVFVPTNVTSIDDVQALVDKAVETYGKLDCAFNNAGIEGELASVADYKEEDWDRVFDINVKGVHRCMKVEIPAMLEAGGGAIVNSSSTLAVVGAFNMPAYVASKAAVVGLTRTAALECTAQNIRVNAVLPGVVSTPMMEERIFGKVPQLRDMLLAQHPIGRFAKPEEIADTAVWLCSDRSSFTTASSLVVDGGYIAN